jgi:hypothetical protein
MKYLLGGIVIGVSILCGFALQGYLEYQNRLISSIHVEGKAEKQIKADLFDWNFKYEAVGDDVQEVKDSIKKAKQEIVSLLIDSGLKRDEDFIIKPKQLLKTKTNEGKDVFTISQDYEIKTQKMSEASLAYKNSEILVEKGISITTTNTDIYKIKDKKDLENQLIAAAIKDAAEKAEKLAATTGSKIIGAPSSYWSYIRLKDSNASDDSWKSGSIIDQIATMEINIHYNIRRK